MRDPCPDNGFCKPRVPIHLLQGAAAWGTFIQPAICPRVVADAGSAAERPAPAAAAQQLADVAAAVYEAGGPGIHLPLDGQHALVAVLRKALEREGKERPGKEWQVGRRPACAVA